MGDWALGIGIGDYDWRNWDLGIKIGDLGFGLKIRTGEWDCDWIFRLGI